MEYRHVLRVSLLSILAAAFLTYKPTSPAAILAQGGTFYVATNGDNNTGDGSAGSPWFTINHALDNVPDGSTILVRPGTYTGRVRLRGTFTQGVIVRSEVPYQARLRHTTDETVVTCFYGKGITLEGFDIAHTSANPNGGLVIQIQDLIGPAAAPILWPAR